MLAVSGCANGPEDSFCLIAQPIRPTVADADTMSDSLVDQVDAHNAVGERLCGWKP